MEQLMQLILPFLYAHPWIGFVFKLWVLYIGFVMYSGLQASIRERRWGVVVPCLPILIPAGLIDMALSPVIGLLVFHELKFKWTISGRLDSHYWESGWRGDRARLIGKWINWILPYHIG